MARLPHNDAEANRRHLEALVGGRTHWREHIEQGTKVLDVSWDKLPLKFRQEWWKATDYGRHPPAPEFTARMSELLAIEQAKLENLKREIAADTARAKELLSRGLTWRRMDLLRLRCWRCIDWARYLPRRISKWVNR